MKVGSYSLNDVVGPKDHTLASERVVDPQDRSFNIKGRLSNPEIAEDIARVVFGVAPEGPFDTLNHAVQRRLI